MVHNQTVDDIKELAMDTNIREFDEIYLRKFDHLDENVDTMIEKMAILTHIFNREFQMYLECNQEQNLMSKFWNGKYADETQIK